MKITQIVWVSHSLAVIYTNLFARSQLKTKDSQSKMLIGIIMVK